MAQLLPLDELEGRIDCFGEFDRADEICLGHCSLNFDCAAAREHIQELRLHDESLGVFVYTHNA